MPRKYVVQLSEHQLRLLPALIQKGNASARTAGPNAALSR
jgi:hypothetical protein